MARIKKGVSLFPVEGGMATGYGDAAPDQPGGDLVFWLNMELLGLPADAPGAVERVGGLIERLNAYLEVLETAEKSNYPYIRMLRDAAPYYRFEFDLYPPADKAKWRLIFQCFSTASGDSYNSVSGLDLAESIELEAVGTVIDLALAGRLGTIRRCQVCDCRKWFITKNDPRVRCCPEHSSDDLRTGTAERKEQARAASKNAREREKKAQEQAVERLREEKENKRSSHRGRR